MVPAFHQRARGALSDDSREQQHVGPDIVCQLHQRFDSHVALGAEVRG